MTFTNTLRPKAASALRAPTLVTELVPHQLYLLGDSIELDGRISWVPAATRGWQPINCYVAVQGDSALIIDPGIALHSETVVEQLKEIVPSGMPVSIFLTRAEPDSTGGIGAIARNFPVTGLYAGGGPNPFDSFDSLGEPDLTNRRERIQLERMAPGFSVPVGVGRGVEVLRPSIRLLATYWGYDSATRTLFTSDSFGHAIQPERGSPRLLTANSADRQCEVADVKAHLTSKFEWLAHARTPAIIESLRAMFTDRIIERIAPAHGMVIEGTELVEAHRAAMETALTELAA